MSNPCRPPQEPTQLQLSLASGAPDAFLPDGFQDLAKEYRTLEKAQQMLSPLDMEVRSAFYLQKRFACVDSVRSSPRPILAQAHQGVPTPRVRSRFAKALVNEVFDKLPSEGLFSKEVVGSAMRKRVFVEGGTNATLGRVAAAYPAKGSTVPAPITSDEASGALERCGLSMARMPPHALRAFPLLPKEGEAGISVNPHSDNGFPVLGKWDTPGAAATVMELAVAVRLELSQAKSVSEWKLEAEQGRPWLVACCGKAKADYYALEKVVEGRLRFYNVIPRQILLIQQIATQPFERLARCITDDPFLHTGIGVTLTRGGAADLVGALDIQLKEYDYAYVHVGDDSWVAMRDGADIVMFALDCSNFDLTQHGDATRAVHERLRDELAKVDRVSADLWLAYARERLVVVQGSLVRLWRHAGPSGMPLQSKVNDMLMDVLIRRVLGSAPRRGSEKDMDAAIRHEGQRLGFSVRVEQYWRGRAANLVEALEQRPFLFIGYYFHVRGAEVLVCADMPRTLAQVPYPAQKWAKSEGELVVREAMRLGSIALNLGMPTRELEESVAVFRREALKLVDEAIARFGDVADEKLRWAVQESPWGATTEASLSGLRRAITRDARTLWVEKELELPSTSILVSTSWADEVEDAEASFISRLGAVPAMVPGVRRAVLPAPVVPTHPVTRKNDGRSPPTAVWGPPKQARESAPVSARRRRKDGIAYREFHQELEDEWESDWSDES